MPVIKFELSNSSAECMKEMNVVSENLRSEIVGFVNDWLFARGMKVITDDDEKEPVTTSGATADGDGRVSISFYFKRTFS